MGENPHHYSPASTLPAEILLVIFGFIRIAYEVAKEQPSTLKINLAMPDVPTLDETFKGVSWMSFSQVCYSWREIALGSSGLWSLIEIEEGKCRWAIELLERSNQSLLTIHLDLRIIPQPIGGQDTSIASNAMSSARNHFDRCKALKILAGDKEDVTLDQIIGGHTMPNLCSLSIDRNDSSSMLVLSDKELKAESLSTLKLSHVKLDYGAAFLRGLTALQLHMCFPEFIPFILLLDHLSSLTSLKQLDIHASTFSLPPADGLELIRTHPLYAKPMQLTDLTILSFLTPTQATELLRVVAKNSVCLNITILGMNHDAEELSDFFSALSDHIIAGARSGRPVCGYNVCYTPAEIVVLEGYCDIMHGSTIHGVAVGVEPILQVKMNFQDRRQASPSLVELVAQHIKMDGVVSLNSLARNSYAPLDWNRTFGAYHTLKSVSIHGPHIYDFFESLCDNLAFPALEQILGSVQDSLLHNFESGPMLRSLQSRKNHGRSIRFLHLIGSSRFSAKMANALRSVVESFMLVEDPNSPSVVEISQVALTVT